MKYEKVWEAVDKLAKSQGLSPSALAKKAGLDSTTFNKSKRTRPDGKKRWPSLDSINKLLEVCNIGFEQFYGLSETSQDIQDIVPSIPFAKASELEGLIKKEDASINTKTLDMIRFPDNRENLYALELNNDDFFPTYRLGTIIVAAKNSEIRRGDRIIIFAKNNSILIFEFVRRTASCLEVLGINNNQEQSFPISNIQFVNRILWASQ